MNTTNKTLKEQMEETFAKVKANGGKTTKYFCHHHKDLVETVQPTKELVSSKGFWDSMKTCHICENLNFVTVWPSGKTESVAMSEDEEASYVYTPLN